MKIIAYGIQAPRHHSTPDPIARRGLERLATGEGGHRARKLCARRCRRCHHRLRLDSVEAARRYTDDFPLSKAGLLEWHFLAFDPAPLPLEYLFDATVDIAQPWDRTAA